MKNIKIKKFLSMALTVVMVCSMLALPTFAVEDPYADPYYPGFDWSEVDTSMCIPYTEYHAFSQDVEFNPRARAASRSVFSGWVYSVPKNNYPATSTMTIMTGLTFNTGESGRIEVSYTDCTDTSSPTMNISLYSMTTHTITDYFTISKGSSNSFYVDAAGSYNIYVSNNGAGTCNARFQIFAS
jgi:hypothetical protein